MLICLAQKFCSDISCKDVIIYVESADSSNLLSAVFAVALQSFFVWGAANQHMKTTTATTKLRLLSVPNQPPMPQSVNNREMATSSPDHHREAKTALTPTAKLQQPTALK